MLNYNDYDEVDKLEKFVFHSLSVCGVDGVYSDTQGNKYSIQETSREDAEIIDVLGKKGGIINYKGTLKKKGVYSVFSELESYETLASFIKKNNYNKALVGEKFCSQLIQTMLLILSELEVMGVHFKILTPFHIGLKNPEHYHKIGFGLLLPFPHRSFSLLTKLQYNLYHPYAAPEIISFFQLNPNAQTIGKQFGKACLFSLGLVLLDCFVNQHVQYTKLKEFKKYFKSIRKEVRVLHGGKYVPKVMKLLVESCEKTRDSLRTFQKKIHSIQFESLKVQKYDFQDMKITTMLTRSDGGKNRQQKSTIMIQGSQSSNLTITCKQKMESFQKNEKISPNFRMEESPVQIDIPQDEEEKMGVNERSEQIQQLTMMEIKQKEKIQQIRQENKVITYNISEIRIGNESPSRHFPLEKEDYDRQQFQDREPSENESNHGCRSLILLGILLFLCCLYSWLKWKVV